MKMPELMCVRCSATRFILLVIVTTGFYVMTYQPVYVMPLLKFSSHMAVKQIPQVGSHFRYDTDVNFKRISSSASYLVKNDSSYLVKNDSSLQGKNVTAYLIKDSLQLDRDENLKWTKNISSPSVKNASAFVATESFQTAENDSKTSPHPLKYNRSQLDSFQTKWIGRNYSSNLQYNGSSWLMNNSSHIQNHSSLQLDSFIPMENDSYGSSYLQMNSSLLHDRFSVAENDSITSAPVLNNDSSHLDSFLTAMDIHTDSSHLKKNSSLQLLSLLAVKNGTNDSSHPKKYNSLQLSSHAQENSNSQLDSFLTKINDTYEMAHLQKKHRSRLDNTLPARNFSYATPYLQKNISSPVSYLQKNNSFPASYQQKNVSFPASYLQKNGSSPVSYLQKNNSYPVKNNNLTSLKNDSLHLMKNVSSQPKTKVQTPSGAPVKVNNIEHVCHCKVEKMKGVGATLSTMQSVIPWLNHTTEQELVRRHPNYPTRLSLEMSRKGKCNLLPSHLSIKWSNSYWQEFDFEEKSSFFAYSAIYDNRTASAIGPCLRIIGVSRTVHLPKPWCHLWFNSTGPPAVSRVQKVDLLDYQKRNKTRQNPYLLSCPVPLKVAHLKPSAVSLVKKPCQKTSNLLQVIGEGKRGDSAWQKDGNVAADPSRESYSVAVCGPALYFYHNDYSFRLVEWLELLRSLGVAKVFLLDTDVHPNVEAVLRYYEDEGFIDVTKYSYPPPYLNIPSLRRLWTTNKRQEMFSQENIYFTDCLLRHMHEYRFIAHHDPDEVPVFIQDVSYSQFLQRHLQKSKQKLEVKKGHLPVGYKLKWRMFYNDASLANSTKKLPDYLYTFRHIMRPKVDLRSSPGVFKTLYDMDEVTGVFSHSPLFCASGKCPSSVVEVSMNESYLAHFTWSCGKKCKAAESMKEEHILLRKINAVQAAVETVLKKLGLL